MEFGHIEIKDLEKIKFSLPADPPANAAVLKKGKKKLQVFLGCAKWGRKEWIGKIYPPGTPEKDFPVYYGQHYDSIELNATHYKLYGPEQLQSWMQKMNNPKFKFCPKAHRGMSFLKDSPSKKNITSDFIHNIRTFGKQLGPVFITHDEKIKWDAEGEKQFFNYLESLPKDIDFFVEERWLAFYTDKKLMDRYYARLRELKIGAIITDAAGRPDVLHMQLTIPKAFIRFVGNSLHPSDYPRIDNWAKRLKKWADAGIEEIYFFMHMRYEGLSPELTQYVVERFNKVCGFGLPPVKFIANLSNKSR